MEDSDLRRALEEHAPALLAEHDLIALYLTGSRARGQAHADSDVDLAVLPRQPGTDPMMLAAALSARLEPVVHTTVDVVLLDQRDLLLLGSALKDAVLIACANHPARVAFEVAAMSTTLDFELHARPLRDELLAQTARGQR